MQKLRSNPNQLLKAAAAMILLAIAVSLTAYPLPAQAQSTDATLSALTVSPEDIIGFTANGTFYQVGVASTVTQATIIATATDSNATIVYSTVDADGATGHQVNLSSGKNTVIVTVTAEDTSTTKAYTVNINRGVTDEYGWNAEHDLDGLTASYGIWGNSSTIWVVDRDDTFVYAYNRDGSRDTTKEFDLHTDNSSPRGVWSNGTTAWIADSTKVFAYTIATKTRNTAKEFNFASENDSPWGVWSDDTTMWITNDGNVAADRKVFAYRLSDGERQPAKDFDLDTSNTDPRAIWSNGTTAWVVKSALSTSKIFAYRLDDGARVAAEEFNTLSTAGVNFATGLWSDEETMWVGEALFAKVYAFNMPHSDDATLSALTVAPKDIIGFAADQTSYEVGVASTVTQATITATKNHSGANVVYSGTDADSADGHQVALSAGKNTVTVTVTAENPSFTETYTVNVNRGVTTDYGWNA